MIEVKKISGIHNYCNRWCERCNFTERCAVALHEKKTKEKRAESSKKDVWGTVHDNLQEAFGLLKDMLKEMEGDLEDIISDEIDNDDLTLKKQAPPATDNQRKQLFSHINEASKNYGFATNDWFTDNHDILKDKEQQLKQLHTIGATHITQDAKLIKEALAVIQWNMFLVGAKLNRATRDDDFPMIEDDPIQTDANGSAKVALIAIEDSLVAWNVLREMIPELSDELLGTLATLSRLKKDTLKAFPDALKFVRPGFDDGQ